MTTPRATAFNARRRLHPLTLLFAAIPIARTSSYLAALVAAVLADRGWAVGEVIAWALLTLSVPALLAATARYLSFRYRLGIDELVIESGLLHKQHRVIPLSRVQNLDLRQSALQRLLGVAQLRVETASGNKDVEVELAVLGRPVAEGLRTEILASRDRHVAISGAEQIGTHNLPLAASATPLVHLSPSDLALAGATANKVGFLIAALAGVWRLLDDFLPQWEPIVSLVDRLPREAALGSLLLALGTAVILILVGWGVSVVGAVIGYYDFTLERTSDGLRERYGFFSRHEGNIPLRRVQALRIEESILRRPFVLAAMRIETAGATPEQRKEDGVESAEAFVPLVRQRDASHLVASIFGQLEYRAIDLRPVHPRSQRRAFTRYAAVLGIMTLVIAPWAPRLALIPPFLIPFAWILAHWQYRHRGYAFTSGYIIVRNGVLNRITWIVPRHKLQTLHLTETFFQRRHGLASVVIDTAAGGQQAVVRDLGRAEAEGLIAAIRHESVSLRRSLPAKLAPGGTDG